MTGSDIEVLRVNAALIRKNLQWSCVATNIGTKKMNGLKKVLMRLENTKDKSKNGKVS